MAELTTGSSSKPKHRLGRRTVQTPERAKIICDALARGLPFVHACAIAGISFQTFSVWRTRDEKFRAEIDRAIALGVERRLKTIETAADTGDWRASAWLLEHCQPEHFSKSRIQVEAVGAIEHSFVIPQQTLNDIVEARARHERKQQEQNQLEPAALGNPEHV
jgi:hypothetical protein